MTRRVYLHVGSPKSGTTYLQDRIRRNADLVTAQGLTYVPVPTRTHFLPALDLIQRRWGGALERANGAWENLVRSAANTPGDLLISHEILAAATPEQVDRAHAAFVDDELHIVYGARDLGRQVPAEWQEQLKHRAKSPFPRFVQRVVDAPQINPELWFWRVQSLPDVLTRWGTGLPPDRVHLVTVPPAGAPRTLLWERMCGLLGLDPSLEYAETPLVNSSIGIDEAAVIRRLNVLLPPSVLDRDDYVRLVRNVVVRDTLARREGMSTAAVPAEHRPFFDEVAGSWVDWIEGSGIDVTGDPVELRPVWHDDPDRPGGGPRAMKVVDAAVEALAAVILAAAGDAAETGAAAEPSLARRVTRRVLGS